MGQVDRIPPVPPAFLQTQASSSVNERKEGRQNTPEQEKHDKLELHDEMVEELELEPQAETIELFPEHGLDLTA